MLSAIFGYSRSRETSRRRRSESGVWLPMFYRKKTWSLDYHGRNWKNCCYKIRKRTCWMVFWVENSWYATNECISFVVISSLFKSGDELRWTFTSDSSVNGWGWKFTVYPVTSNHGTKELGSDRAVLSQPSMDMVMKLLDPKLYQSANSLLMSRLAAALASCSQLSSLCKYSQIYILICIIK